MHTYIHTYERYTYSTMPSGRYAPHVNCYARAAALDAVGEVPHEYWNGTALVDLLAPHGGWNSLEGLQVPVYINLPHL